MWLSGKLIALLFLFIIINLILLLLNLFSGYFGYLIISGSSNNFESMGCERFCSELSFVCSDIKTWK